MINQYAIINTGNDNVKEITMDKTFQERVIKCINTCIEFCIEIGSVEFLLNDLQPIFDNKGFGDLFIERLEPFILCDRIINEKLQQFTITKIIALYEKKKQYLITPIIYIYTNGNDEVNLFLLNRISFIQLKRFSRSSIVLKR